MNIEELRKIENLPTLDTPDKNGHMESWIRRKDVSALLAKEYKELLRQVEAYTRERVEAAEEAAFEHAAKVVREKFIYTGPGSFDPEPVQIILGGRIRSEIKQTGALARAEDAARREEREAIAVECESQINPAGKYFAELVRGASKPTEGAS